MYCHEILPVVGHLFRRIYFVKRFRHDDHSDTSFAEADASIIAIWEDGSVAWRRNESDMSSGETSSGSESEQDSGDATEAEDLGLGPLTAGQT